MISILSRSEARCRATSTGRDSRGGLESQLSDGIHRILAKLLHSGEPELKHLNEIEGILTELPRTRYNEDSRQAWEPSKPLEPRPSIYSTKSGSGSTCRCYLGTVCSAFH
jgi:hypothetical protein